MEWIPVSSMSELPVGKEIIVCGTFDSGYYYMDGIAYSYMYNEWVFWYAASKPFPVIKIKGLSHYFIPTPPTK